MRSPPRPPPRPAVRFPFSDVKTTDNAVVLLYGQYQGAHDRDLEVVRIHRLQTRVAVGSRRGSDPSEVGADLVLSFCS